MKRFENQFSKLLNVMIAYITLKCDFCKKEFEREKRFYKYAVEKYNTKKFFCSMNCFASGKVTSITKKCTNCETQVTRILKEIKKSKSGNVFCSQSCAAKYNNAHKTIGTRRSKLEVWLESQLPIKYPNLEFHFNRKDTINSELDIHIPSLNLAFELNGIFHYEPIYGENKLNQIQNNDTRKFQACLEHKIELCIIDTSSFIHFKEQKALKYLDIICQIIDAKVA